MKKQTLSLLMLIFKCILIGNLIIGMAACSEDNEGEPSQTKLTLPITPLSADESPTDKPTINITPTNIVFALDWTPNTNHTGLYVAIEKGFFEAVGLNVTIILPGKVGSSQLIASGQADFGISFQEYLMMARNEGLPLVSIAAVVQHNTAGYASLKEKGIHSPQDFVGKVFGTTGTELESALLKTVMTRAGLEASQVISKNIGMADYFTAIKRDIDFALVYQGWTGIEAEIRGLDLTMIYLKDLSPELDFYTPVLATNENFISQKPEIIKAFLLAVSQGYEFAAENPEESATILLKYAPDLDETLVRQSQQWLSKKYQEGAPQFGWQEFSRWQTFAQFMQRHNLINPKLATDEAINHAFTNDFLPTK